MNVKYLNHHLLDKTQMLSLSLDDQTIFNKSLKLRQPIRVMSSYGEIRGKLRGNLECGSAQPSLFLKKSLKGRWPPM